MIKRFLKNVASVLMLVSFAAVAQAATLPKAEVSKLPALTLSAGNYSVWNGSLTEGTVDRQLQVVMNFKAMETAEEARPNGYLMHKCDFYLTFTGIKDESKKLMAKDCFLAGNYGDFGWIVIPTDDVEIEEGVQYPVVAGYDANITYKQICESVKNFTAAIHVAPAILEANPDFKVKLELRMTNPDNADDYFTVGEPAIYTADELKNGSGELPDATVSKLSALTLAPNSYSTYDGSLHKNDEKTASDRPLQIVMNFKANDTEETAKASGFDKYLCDFYLKFTGLKEGKITADNCYLAGNYGDFGWIVIPADGLELEEGVEYPVVSGYDATLNYKDICKSVKDFTAAIHVAPAILEANPDFKVSLALRMTHPENKAYFNVGAPIVYSVADLKPVAKVVVPKAEDVKVNGEALTASDKATVENIIKEFSLNNDLTVGDNGIVCADNSDEVASARSALVDAGVEEAQAAAAVPSVAVTFTEIKKNDEGKIVQMVFDVTPAVAVGDKSVKISSFSSDITFRLPVYSENSGNAAKIYHDGVFAGVYAIKGEGANKYVEVASKTFSTYTVEPIAVEGVARIGETGYATLEAAYTAAQAGDTVTFLNNVAVNNNDAYGLMIEKAITIDGNGKTITVADGYANTYALMYLYAISGKVTIKNLTFDGVKSGAAIWAHDADVEIDNCVFQNGEHTQVQGLVRTTCANLTVKNSQFKNNNCNFAITFNYDAAESDTMLVENCDFVGNTVNDTSIVYYVDGASSTIKDCTFVDNTVKSASHGAVVYYSNGANGSLTGNVFSGNKITAGGVRASVLALEAGTTASENAFVGNTCVSTASGTTYVGTVLNKADADSAGVAISGNYWGGSEPDCVSTKGAPVVLENYYTTYESGVLGGLEAIVANVAKIGTTGYATLLQAFAAAKSGDTVSLLGDLTLQAGDIDYYQNIKIPAGVTFDGGNYELVVMESQDSDYAVIWSDGAYTVHNLSIKVMGRREANRSVFNFSKGGKISNVKIWAQVLDIGVNYDKPVDGMSLIVENCEISNVTYAFYCDPNASDIDVTIKNNVINSQRFGSMQHDEKIEGNTLTATCTKGISLGASFTGIVTGNTFAGARALSVYGNQTISGNVFSSTSIVELNNGAVADLSGNYWGGEAPSESQIVADGATSVVSFTVENYYTNVEEDGTLSGLVTVASNVAEVNGVQYATFIEALQAAVESGASEVKILRSVREKMPADIEVVVKSDLVITADSAVVAEFYNDGTNYDFVFNSEEYGNHKVTFAQNVSFVLVDRVIWFGYYGNNVDVQIDGTVSGFQIWNGADTVVSPTGLLKSSGEALVMRRGALLHVDGGKIEANYFNILAGQLFAENGADIDCGAFWVDNSSHSSEGNVVINIWNSTLDCTGNIKTAGDNLYIDIYESVVNIDLHDGVQSVIGRGTYLDVDGEGSILNIKTVENNGEIEVYDDAQIVVNGTIANKATVSVATGSSVSATAFNGNGSIIVDAEYIGDAAVQVIEADMSGFTGAVEVLGAATAKITDDGLIVTPKTVSGKVAYRAYVTNNDSRNAVQIDLENLYAKESVVVKLLDADGKVLTVTTLKAGGADAASFTVNAVLWGEPSSSWNTEIKQTLTVDNAPATIQLWLDGKLCDTFENAMGDKMDDYLALGCVYKEASIGTKYYGSFASALAAAQDGDTISLLADAELAGTVTIDKSIAIEGNGKRVTTADGFAANGSNAMIDLVKNVTFGNIVFDGVKNVAVMRSVGGDIVMDQCVVKNCNQTVSQGLLRLACCDATITDCQFVDNTCTMVVSFGYDAANDDDVLLIDGCSFERNTCKETAVVYMADGDYGKVTDTLFADNNVRSAGNAATLYMGWGDGSEVSGCTFKDNTVVTAHATTKRFASAIFCDGCIVNENAFIGNAATRNGETIATIVAVGAYYGAANISANFWGKAEPEAGVDFTVEYTRQDVAFDSYYTSIDEDGNLVNLVEFVARIGVAGYSSIDAALAAAMDGDTVVLLADATIQNEYVVENKSLTIAGAATLTFDDTLKVKGESTLNISAQITDSVQLLDGTILKDSTINGTVFVAGNVLFRGANTVKMVYDYGVLTDYYGTSAPMCWTVEPGASLVITDKARYGLGYGDQVTIKGNLSDAKSARSELTDADASLVTHGLVAQESKGWNKDSSLTVNSAYVRIGDNNSFGNKPGNYGGAYQFKFVNSVLDASRITFYEALSTTEFLFKDSDVKMGTFMTRDADSVFTLDNTVLLSTTTSNGNDEGNYHAGKLILDGSVLTYSAEWKIEATGVVEMDATSSITAPKITGTGKIVIDARTVADTEKQVIFADMSGFSADNIEVIGGEYEIINDGINNGVVVKKPSAYAYFDGYYYEKFEDAFADAMDSDMSKVSISVLGDSTVGMMEIPAGKSMVLDLGGKKLTKDDGAKIVVNNANVKFTNGTLDGFTAANVEIMGDSVVTFPAKTVDLSAFADTFYKTTNEDGSVSVATKFRSFIQVESGVPCIGFLKNANSEYKVYGKAELTDADWTLVDMAAADVVSDYPALPLKWFVPAVDTFRFFKVEMVEEK